jgi:hypothetical protein
MADRLDKLPTKNTELSDSEKDTIQKFFGEGDSSPTKEGQNSILKLVGYTTLLFVALANPFINPLLEKIPYCDSAAGTLALKTVLFMILFFIIYRYLV